MSGFTYLSNTVVNKIMSLFKPTQNSPALSRRAFLRTTIGGSLPLAVSGSLVATQSASAAAAARELPRRKLGRNGPDVTIISQGGSMSAHSAMFLELAWANGIRYFDASVRYLNGQCERNIRDFLARDPSRRKDLFLVTKDAPGSPRELLSMIDNRLAALQTDYVDLFFIHGINTRRPGMEALNWPKSDEFRETAQKLKESGKVKMVGFSCHDEYLVDFMNAAAEGGFLDAIMVQYDPFHEKGSGFDKALTACHEAGIGLVAMKNFRAVGEVSKRLPGLDQLGLTTHEAVVQKVMSDKRISAMCLESSNNEQLQENTGATLKYDESRAIAAAQILRQHVMLASHPVCPGCESCREIGKQPDAVLGDIARYVTYYAKDGKQAARDYYRELPKASLEASKRLARLAKDGCQYKVDYPVIMEKAAGYFA